MMHSDVCKYEYNTHRSKKQVVVNATFENTVSARICALLIVPVFVCCAEVRCAYPAVLRLFCAAFYVVEAKVFRNHKFSMHIALFAF